MTNSRVPPPPPPAYPSPDASGYRIALVVNEHSRGGLHREAITETLYRELNAFQTETGHSVAVSFTRTREHVERAVVSLQKAGCNLFIVLGGDGTLNDVIQHLSEGTFLVPIPGGNANDFAKRLNIGHWRDTVAVVKNVLRGRVNVIGLDLGELSFRDAGGNRIARRFLNNCGLGVTADTVAAVEGQINKRYLLAGFLTLMRARPFELVYRSSILRRNIPVKMLGAEILLTRQVGRYAHFAPYKHQNDGTLHFTVFPALPPHKRLLLMALLRFGPTLVRSGLVQYFHARQDDPDERATNPYGLSIRDISSVWGSIRSPINAHVDGNLIPEFPAIAQTDCRVRVLPKFLRTVAPC